MKTQSFEFEKAFDRNLGWLTPAEQEKLRRSTVAIAGLGGTGGYQAMALARLGVSRFRFADPDRYEITNINRQLGAFVSTLERPKIEVIEKMILDINPAAEVELFGEGLTAANAGRFLEGAGLAVDGIDFFEYRAKLLLFEEARKRGITALTCAPIGFGATLIIFDPRGMSFADYFDLRPGMSESETRNALTFGLSPSPLCLPYLDRKAIDFRSRRASSVAPGLMLVGAVTASEGVKILTGKWKPKICPHVVQLDLLTQKMRTRWYPMGMRSPWQRLKKAVLMRMFRLDAGVNKPGTGTS